MKMAKRLFTMALALMMILSLAVPAFAAEEAETYTIVINHPQKKTNHIYEAYQIFSGELSVDEATGREVLSNIEWGDGVDGDALLAALKTESSLFADATDAQTVADVLSKNNTNTALVNTFRHVVGEHLIAEKAVEQNAVSEDGVYTWNNMPAGYYLIKDQDGSLEGTEETATNYILQVVGDTTVKPKGGGVTHDKLIEDGGNRVEVADYSIGDDVKFVLRGTLPANYADFVNYSYKFVDTLSAGLTFNNDVKVYVETSGSKLELTTGYVVNSVNPTVTGATFTVDFADLKQITEVTVESHSTIIVEYTAKLNEDAVIGGNGNPNESYVIFDNDPHNEGEGETPKDKVFAFTWELDVFKIDGNNNKLADAEFVLYRNIDATTQYVKVNADGEVTDWTVDETEASILKSDSNGKFIVKGLEADVYYLKETKAPEGFNLLEQPITVDISATISESADGTTAVVDSLQIKVDNHPAADGDKEHGIVSMNVVNNPGATLPETGGIGTTLFYVFGALLVAASFVLLVTKKRMTMEN